MAAMTYGTVAYLAFLCTLCYAVLFVADVLVPKTIDSGMPGPFWPSVAVNAALLSLFAIQHSVMARPGFKDVWTKIVPKPIERSTFVYATCVVFALMFWQWRPMVDVIWQVDNPMLRVAIYGLQVAGYLFAVLATMMIHHFDLFGLRQVYLFARGERPKDLGFRTRGFYNLVRHPIMLGFLVGFWASPTMTAGHLMFALMTTGYVLVAVQLEERDLVRHFGSKYEEYKRRVPAILPLPTGGGSTSEAASGAVGD
ncbi:MAG: isoprenylcysteine carboxylmethyltransferase family protein [bacterium]|nr:isoprenylcysteine carboxylmethyltransferase family protein [bacterium]